MDRTEAISKFRGDVGRWRRKARIYAGVHLVLGLTAMFASSLVAGTPDFLGSGSGLFTYSNLAWLASFATSMLTFFSAQQRSAKYGSAATILDNQIILYDADTTFTLKHVIDAKNLALQKLDSK
jgi:hypothetical protein